MPQDHFVYVGLQPHVTQMIKPGVWGFSATSSIQTQMKTTPVTSTLASMTRRRSGDDLVVGRPWQNRLHTIEQDFKLKNLGLWCAWHTAYDCDQWRQVVEMAMLQQGHATVHDDNDDDGDLQSGIKPVNQ